jgi:uncharacterized membrane protein
LIGLLRDQVYNLNPEEEHGGGKMSLNSEILQENNQKNRTPGNVINVGGMERLACAITGGALAAYGLRQRSAGGLILTLAGAALLHRGSSGHCHTYKALGIDTTRSSEAPVARDIHIEKSIIIDKSPEELYRFWRQFENLPRFMKHLESVSVTGLNRWHWVAKGPARTKVEWDAEVYNEKPNELIAWRSLEGADITNAGSVHFEPAPNGRGTLVKVVLNYNAPGGKISALLAKLFGQEPGQMIEEDLRRLKQVLETGEVATIEGQPSGRAEQAAPLNAAPLNESAAKAAGKAPVSELERSRAASSGKLSESF